MCITDGYCNPCCLAGTDKDCGATTQSQQTLSKPETKTPEDEADFKWPEATPTPYAPKYSLSLKCARAAKDNRVTAILTADGAPKCDPDMRLTVKDKTLVSDASKCAATGEHYFDISGLERGEFKATATSLGGSTASCTLKLAAAAGFDWWIWLVLAIIIIALAAGGYYYYAQKKGKGKGGAGGARGGARGEETPAEETDLLDEAEEA
jgi:hypothetical protein